MHQFEFGGLQRLGDTETLDQLGNLGADHMGTEQFAGLGVEHGLDQALRLAQRNRLAVGEEGIAADLDLVALRLGCSLCQRSEEHTSEPQPLMRISYSAFCLK